MSRTAEELRHEQRKREIEQWLGRIERDEARREGVEMRVIQIIFGVAVVGVGATATGAGAAIGAIVIIGAACCALVYGIDEQSISTIDSARDKAEEREKVEDEIHSSALRELGAE